MPKSKSITSKKSCKKRFKRLKCRKKRKKRKGRCKSSVLNRRSLQIARQRWMRCVQNVLLNNVRQQPEKSKRRHSSKRKKPRQSQRRLARSSSERLIRDSKSTPGLSVRSSQLLYKSKRKKKSWKRDQLRRGLRHLKIIRSVWSLKLGKMPRSASRIKLTTSRKAGKQETKSKTKRQSSTKSKNANSKQS